MKLTGYESRDFCLDAIQYMMHTMYVENISRPHKPKPIVGRGITIQAAGHSNSDPQCNYCKGVGHLLQDYIILKAKKYQYGANHHD